MFKERFECIKMSCICYRYKKELKNTMGILSVILCVFLISIFANKYREFKFVFTILRRSMKSAQTIKNYISGVKTIY